MKEQAKLGGSKPKGRDVPRPPGEGNPDRYSGRVGLLIRERRERLGISAEVLAKACKVKLFTIYGWESGRNAIPLDALPPIAETLKTSIRKLLPAD